MTVSRHASDRGGSAAQAASMGLARLAGLLMVVLSTVQVITGVTALLTGQMPGATSRHLLALSATTWGWVHLLLGVVVGMAGLAVIIGQLWGRLIGILLVAVTMVACFASLSHHPAWSVVGIALGVVTLWALCVFDEAAAAASPTMLD